MIGGLSGRHIEFLVVSSAAFIAVGAGWAVAISPIGAVALIAVTLLGTAYLVSPAAWVAAGSLIVVTSYAVLVPVKATLGLLDFGPLSGYAVLAFISACLAALTVLKVGAGPLIRGGKITALVATFLLIYITISFMFGSSDPQSFLLRWIVWSSAFVLAVCTPRRLVPVVIGGWITLAFFEGGYAIYEFLVSPGPLYEGYLVEGYIGALVPGEGGDVIRARATFGHPIPLASFLTTASVLALFALRFPPGRYLGPLRLLMFSTIVMGTVVTFTRSAWIALFVAVSVGLASRQAGAWARFRVAMLFIVPISVLLPTSLGDTILNRISSAADSTSYLQRATSLRSVPEILDAGLASAVFGVGAGSQKSLYGLADLHGVEGLQVIDNQYITLLVEVGLLGLSIFLAIIWLAFSFMWRKGSATTTLLEDRLVWGKSVALLAVLIAIFFYDGLAWPPTAMLFWAMVGFLARCEQEIPIPATVGRRKEVLLRSGSAR